MGTNRRALNTEDLMCDMQMSLRTSKETIKELRAQITHLTTQLTACQQVIAERDAEVERLKGERDEAHRVMGEFMHKTTMDTALSMGIGQLKGHIDFLGYVIELHMAEYRKIVAESARP